MTAHHMLVGRDACGRCHVTKAELRQAAEPIPCSILPDCPNGCRGGIVGCWSPGGPCPEPDRVGCDTCGPCFHCRPEAFARWSYPDDVEHQAFRVITNMDRQSAAYDRQRHRREERELERMNQEAYGDPPGEPPADLATTGQDALRCVTCGSLSPTYRCVPCQRMLSTP